MRGLVLSILLFPTSAFAFDWTVRPDLYGRPEDAQYLKPIPEYPVQPPMSDYSGIQIGKLSLSSRLFSTGPEFFEPRNSREGEQVLEFKVATPATDDERLTFWAATYARVKRNPGSSAFASYDPMRRASGIPVSARPRVAVGLSWKLIPKK